MNKLRANFVSKNIFILKTPNDTYHLFHVFTTDNRCWKNETRNRKMLTEYVTFVMRVPLETSVAVGNECPNLCMVWQTQTKFRTYSTGKNYSESTI